MSAPGQSLVQSLGGTQTAHMSMMPPFLALGYAVGMCATSPSCIRDGRVSNACSGNVMCRVFVKVIIYLCHFNSK